MTPNMVAEHLTTTTPTCDALADDPRTDQEGPGLLLNTRRCPFDNDTELKSTAESSDKKQTNTLLDGNIITVGPGRFRCVSVFPAKCHWQRNQWSPRHFFPQHHEVRR